MQRHIWLLNIEMSIVAIGSKLGRSFTVDVNKSIPNRPNTMNLVKKWAQELGLSEDFFSSLTRP